MDPFSQNFRQGWMKFLNPWKKCQGLRENNYKIKLLDWRVLQQTSSSFSWTWYYAKKTWNEKVVATDLIRTRQVHLVSEKCNSVCLRDWGSVSKVLQCAKCNYNGILGVPDRNSFSKNSKRINRKSVVARKIFSNGIEERRLFYGLDLFQKWMIYAFLEKCLIRHYLADRR